MANVLSHACSWFTNPPWLMISNRSSSLDGVSYGGNPVTIIQYHPRRECEIRSQQTVTCNSHTKVKHYLPYRRPQIHCKSINIVLVSIYFGTHVVPLTTSSHRNYKSSMSSMFYIRCLSVGITWAMIGDSQTHSHIDDQTIVHIHQYILQRQITVTYSLRLQIMQP